MWKIQTGLVQAKREFDDVDTAIENWLKNQTRQGFKNTKRLLSTDGVRIVDSVRGTDGLHFALRQYKPGDAKLHSYFIVDGFGKVTAERIVPSKKEKAQPAKKPRATRKPAVAVDIPAPAPKAAVKTPRGAKSWSDAHDQQFKIVEEKYKSVHHIHSIMVEAKKAGLSPATYEQQQLAKINKIETLFDAEIEWFKKQGFSVQRRAANLDYLTVLSAACGRVSFKKKIGKATINVSYYVESNEKVVPESLIDAPIGYIACAAGQCSPAMRDKLAKLDTPFNVRINATFRKKVIALIEAAGGKIKA